MLPTPPLLPAPHPTIACWWPLRARCLPLGRPVLRPCWPASILTCN